jgi:LysM repeat protein
MKMILVRVVRGFLGLTVALLSGCATPSFFKSNSGSGPLPEDTLIKRQSVRSEVGYGRTIAIPMRPEPEPEPEEVLIVAPEEEEVVPEAAGVEYVVKKGDCLCWIARKYDIPLRDLLEANALDQNTKLSVGQKLILPGVTEAQLTQKVDLPMEYKVQKGDCLSKIARKHGLKVHEIKAANGLTSDRIVVGKKLIIPEPGRYAGAKSTATQKVAAKVEKAFVVDSDGYYTVQKGDVLSNIAARAKVSLSELQNWNNLEDPSKIRVGQRIIVERHTPINVPSAVHPTVSQSAGEVGAEPRAMAPGRYDFGDDADFFGKIDDIPVIQVRE